MCETLTALNFVNQAIKIVGARKANYVTLSNNISLVTSGSKEYETVCLLESDESRITGNITGALV